MSINTETAPIQALDIFPEYPTRDEVIKATGKTPPAYDQTKPGKNWADPNALTAPNGVSTVTGVQYFSGFAIYPILKIVSTPSGFTATPDALVLQRVDAAAFNLPDANKTYAGTVPAPVAVPQRSLAANEGIEVQPGGMGIRLVNLDIRAAKQAAADIAAGKFTAADRDLLQRIAAALKA